MASFPTIDEKKTTDTTPLPHRSRTRRIVALYAFLALLAIIIGAAIGVHQHHAASMITSSETIAVPTEQSVVATVQPGVPTPTPLATKPPSPTPVLPTEPPTITPPTPIPPTAPAIAAPAVAAPVRSAPAVSVNQNGEHQNGNGNGKGKGKDKGKGD